MLQNNLLRKQWITWRSKSNDKIKTLHNVLAELEEKLKKAMVPLEGSMQNIETSTKKKFEEIRKVLKENGETAEEKHVFILDSLDKLNSAVNSDLKTKVADFDMHITSIRTSKDEADKLLEELQTVVEKIRPNTFNKDSAVKAFLVVVVFVLILAFWVFQITAKCDRTKEVPLVINIDI
ncbi:uncharacterized protein LOC132730217 [Ruditapes philippinarum]|uniref:uncharacterized protein LOC132730217 n=1 Tax=Ruditapes philippinarum TaxID=129788 RepID=UPI00295AB1A1|nr:uncharacterized protein LOC132730217 [Ruditapes philippinarum]